MSNKAVYTPIGKMSNDIDKRLVEPTDYLDATEILNGKRGYGAVLRHDGNELQPNTQPEYLGGGTSTVMSAFEHKGEAKLFYFVYSSTNDHRIIFFDHITKLYTIVARGAGLGFDLNYPPHSCEFIDDIMVWTDGRVVESNALLGGTPKRLNWRKSIMSSKQKTYELIFDSGSSFQQTTTYAFSMKSVTTGATVGGSPVITIPIGYEDTVKGMKYLATQINSLYSTSLIATYCDCKITITCTNTTLFATLVSSNNGALLVPINHIGFAVSAQQISLALPYPQVVPTTTMDIGPASVKQINEGEYQFRCRYHFDGGQKSAWGSVSNTAIYKAGQFSVLSGQYAQLDYQKQIKAIAVDYTDPNLSDVNYLPFIESIEIAVRMGGNGLWKRAALIPRCEAGVKKNKFTFFNDASLPVIASDDESIGSNDTQVLRLNDNVPQNVSALVTDTTQDGHTRLFLHGCKEGYEGVSCVDAAIATELDVNSSNCYITGTIELIEALDTPRGFLEFGNNSLNILPLYLAGTDYKTLIMPQDWNGSGQANFIIGPIKKGKYFLRAASPYCRFDDINGEQYNLSRGRNFHGTSAPMGGNVYEKEINMLTVNTVNIGTWEMWNGATILADNMEAQVVDGYLCKDTNDTFQQTGRSAFRVERAVVTSTVTPFSSDECITDHNGYWYFIFKSGGAGWVGEINMPTSITVKTWYGTWELFDRGSLPAPNFAATGHVDLTGNVNDTINLMFEISSYSFATFIANFTATMIVYVANALGQAQAGVSIVASHISRVAVTGSNGTVEIIGCGRFLDPAEAIDGKLFCYYEPDGYFVQPFTPVDNAYYVVNGNVDFYEFAIANGTPKTNLDQWTRRLKDGGIYDIGIVYEDAYGRTNGVTPIGEVRIPLRKLESTYPEHYKVRINISHKAPLWATGYRIVRSNNKLHGGYAIVHTPSVKYYRREIDGTLTSVAYNAGYTFIGLEMASKIPNTISTVGEGLFTTYLSEVGDIARLYHIKDRFDLPDSAALDGRVMGTYEDTVAGKSYILIDNLNTTEDLATLEDNLYIEYIKPNKVATEIYYEACDRWMPINAGGYHTGDIQSQDLSQGTAKLYLYSGDTYLDYVYNPEALSPHSLYVERPYGYGSALESSARDTGRPFVVDADAKNAYIYNRIRFSGIHVPNSNIDNLGIFGSLDFQHINREFGPITKAVSMPTAMLAICKHKVQPLYVGKGRILDLRGGQSVGRSDQVLHIADPSIATAGTTHPMSVVCVSSRVYFWDRYRHKVWRYAGDGVQEVTQGMSTHFDDRGTIRQKLAEVNDNVWAGYDPFYDLYYLSFGSGSYAGPAETVINIVADSIIYDDDQMKNGWVSRTGLVPDAYGMVQQQFYNLKAGRVWARNSAAPKCKYFGVQYTPSITFVVNQEPNSVKDFMAMQVQGIKKWYAKSISVHTTDDNVMASRIPIGDFVRKERSWYANFLFDENDPSARFLAVTDLTDRRITKLRNGRRLKGRTAVVQLEAVDPSFDDKLENIEVIYKTSAI